MDISTLVASVGHIKELADLLIGERDRQKLAAIKLELTEEALRAKAHLLEVSEATISKDAVIQALRQQIDEMHARQREKERYVLREISAGRGAFAYQLRPSGELAERSDEPPHFLCQPCFELGLKSVLRLEHFNNGSQALACPANQLHHIGLGGGHVVARGQVSRGIG